MIKLFRKIRQKMLTENNFSKYLIYAIGEIILVVIGILIALQINNWNEYRKDRIREQAILKNLQIDFQTNIKNVNDASSNFMVAYEASANLLEIIMADDIINGSEIEQLIDNIINKTKSLDIITGSIDEMLNTGSINLIKDDNLRKQLLNWSYYQSDTEDDIVIYRDYLFDFFVPSLTNKALLRNMEVPDFFEKDIYFKNIAKSNFTIDYNKTIRTVEFENEVYNNTLNYMYAIDSYKVFNDYLSETLKLIESNIDDKIL
ncbi:DUF6090 family protein [Flagellimonas profundi]|uniref:Uncharacterized protein n=1 Tax=Flagellimonas profundi TaxID=2915620 RepID=A0ABS3FDE3_9FLAO|nr:DUF6090 family protein [Allomuricauda profundi]MBO0340601.1 hypothetical protein [Allomuricauda profundi]